MRPRIILTLLALLAATLIAPGVALAADNPYQRGPDPTLAGITATTGSYAVSTATVGRGNGFGGGSLYYPTSTADGTFGGVVVAPGFTESRSQMAWYGPRLASQGFVVFTIDTNTVVDQPGQRGDQMAAALRYLVGSSAAKNRVDPNRLAVMGHSMGGGGTLDAARADPALKAAISLAGFEVNNNFSAVKVPSLVLAMQFDFIAPNAVHSQPFYNSLPASLDKEYVEVAGANHLTPTFPNTVIAAYSIAWLKRYVDSDTRYRQFLCPVPSSVQGVSSVKGTCVS